MKMIGKRYMAIETRKSEPDLRLTNTRHGTIFDTDLTKY